MDTRLITNQNLFDIDWSSADRKAMLKSIPKPKRQKDRNLAPGLSARGVWMKDVSAMDRRSVKAQLAGRGDLRPMWWNFCSVVHQLFSNDGTLESAMYSFHTVHHYITVFKALVSKDIGNITNSLLDTKSSDKTKERWSGN